MLPAPARGGIQGAVRMLAPPGGRCLEVQVPLGQSFARDPRLVHTAPHDIRDPPSRDRTPARPAPPRRPGRARGAPYAASVPLRGLPLRDFASGSLSPSDTSAVASG